MGRPLTEVLSEVAARVAENAALFAGEVPAGDARARLAGFLERQAKLLGAGVDADAETARLHRGFYEALAVADQDRTITTALRETRRSLDDSIERVMAEHLASVGQRPRSGITLSELAARLSALLHGLTARARGDSAATPREIATVTLQALASWTESDPSADRDEMRATIEDRVRDLDRRLAGLVATSHEALGLVIELMALAPTSTLAFWRARHHAAPLLNQSAVRATPLGDRAWIHAAEMLSMADGNRSLAEEVARTTLERHPSAIQQDRMALLRGAWLLLRLERFGEAVRQIADFRASGNLSPEQETVADALDAYACAATGPVAQAVSLGRRAAAGAGFGAQLGASVAVRVLARGDQIDEARDVLDSAPSPRSPADIGATSLLIARGTLAARSGRPTDALEDLRTAVDHLRRVGNRNPSGWPWLDPTVDALMQIGQRTRAIAALDAARDDVFRWNTPIVVAELGRAEARVATSPADEHAARLRAAEALATSEARLEHAWALSGLRGSESAEASRRPSRPDSPAHSEPDPLATLSPRVREIALLVAEGLRDREIAGRLHLSPRTVHSHVATALDGTGARNRVDLARIVHARPAGGQRHDP